MHAKRLLCLFLALFVMLACDMSATNVPTPLTKARKTLTPANTNAANRKVDKFFASFVGKDTPGGAVIVLKDGQTLYKAAYGLANLEDGTPLTVNHAFHLASVGKQMTALAIMMLAQQGKLNYDDPIGKYIPELSHFGKDFTIRQMLHHTSGLPDYNAKLEKAMYARTDQPTNADLVAALSKMKAPSTKPGEAFEYSNPGFDLLGSVIERISGQTFANFMQKTIFGPLGMTHTFSLPNETRRADPLVAMSYTGSTKSPEAYPYDDLDGLYGSGSIYSTVGDMALYDEALYAGTLLPVSALQEAFQPAELNDGTTEPYGFGWELEKVKGQSYVAHSGAWLGFNSDYVRFLDQHFSVIVLLNRDYDYPDDPRIGLKIANFYLKP